MPHTGATPPSQQSRQPPPAGARIESLISMEKLTTLTGVGVPLRRSNVDTDQIIPAVFLKRVTKSGFDDALFYAWRRDPNFVLNQPEYALSLIHI